MFFGGHMAGNHRKLQEDFRAQEAIGDAPEQFVSQYV